MYTPIDIPSSYKENDIGSFLYNIVIKRKPKKIIDFGILQGYSTVALAQAVRDLKEGHVYAYDLFEKYEFNHSNLLTVEANLKRYDLEKLVSIREMDFYQWLKTDEEFDLLHVDISNTGETIEALYDKFKNKTCTIIFEGGSLQRDSIDWMKKYNKKKLSLSYAPYTVKTYLFPSLSELNLLDDPIEIYYDK